MADRSCPKKRRTPVGPKSHTLVVLNHLNDPLVYFHFLNACVPNQKATTELQMIWVSLSHRISSA